MSTFLHLRRSLPTLSHTFLRPTASVSVSSFRSLMMMSGIDDREKALENLYIKEAEKKVMEKLQAKLAAAQRGEVVVNDESKASDELKGLLGKVDEETMKKLMEWKKKAH